MTCSSSQDSEPGGITRVSSQCGMTPPLECPTVFLLYTQSGLEKGVSSLSQPVAPLRGPGRGAAPCLVAQPVCPGACRSCSACAGDCSVCRVGASFSLACFLILLHEALTVVGSPVLVSHTDVGQRAYQCLLDPPSGRFSLDGSASPSPLAHAQTTDRRRTPAGLTLPELS